jgi:hypothetical protein
LEKISASLGLDVEADAEADMWQEFKKGMLVNIIACEPD